ncbi:hypothetical protein BABINDRAFT_163107 [Babjeviella inositovora NRRL Y-12698]|uniref:Cyclin n=1 Tax=Babjeviella inositovora NRRL Y-12698 TaxID=984486 RepID=A0A1E3QLX6_9ASCO|nr:uncharacterized protein BABINDRAFT_163107 [Babjeviella inositovora NRRL Y-12698]ODQ78082.1 hypothetical protein BABINDRAFT_163107 [Babjeviella inositovora NRRL Y-12698]
MDGVRLRESSLLGNFQDNSEISQPQTPPKKSTYDINDISPDAAIDILDRVVAKMIEESEKEADSREMDIKHELEDAMNHEDNHPKKHQRSLSKNNLSSVYTSNNPSLDSLASREPPSPDSPVNHEPSPPNSPVMSPIPTKAMQNRALGKRFQLKSPPPLPILDYLKRINNYCPLSTSVCLAASYYLYTLQMKPDPAIHLMRNNAHRFVLAAIRLAMKSIEDMCHKHKFFSQVGGVSTTEMFRTEVGLLFLMEFNVVITEDKLESYLEEVSEFIGGITIEKKSREEALPE